MTFSLLLFSLYKTVTQFQAYEIKVAITNVVVFQMDRHKYVKVAHHGFKELSKEDKIAAYGNTLIRDSFDEPDYALIDTLFSLAEAFLFAQLVDFRDNHQDKFSSDTE